VKTVTLLYVLVLAIGIGYALTIGLLQR